MSEIAALIARLEAATEGSRTLDVSVAEYLGNEHQWDTAGDDAFIARKPSEAEPDAARLCDLCPRYTRSLDAALTLVPGYHKWIVGVHYAAVWQEDGRLSEAEQVPATGKPALALCIAALKARLP